jgi:hypothetical protein
MNYSEILIGYAQLMATVAGFSALLMALTTGDEQQKNHLDFNIRGMIIQAVFVALLSLCGLGTLSTDLPLSETWRLSSFVFIVFCISTLPIIGVRVKIPRILL